MYIFTCRFSSCVRVVRLLNGLVSLKSLKFADRLTVDLITSYARMYNLLIVSRRSAFFFLFYFYTINYAISGSREINKKCPYTYKYLVPSDKL